MTTTNICQNELSTRELFPVSFIREDIYESFYERQEAIAVNSVIMEERDKHLLLIENWWAN